MGLFSKSDPEPSAAPVARTRTDDETAFLGAQISVKGKVTGGGNLIVMGKLEGEFDLNGEVGGRPAGGGERRRSRPGRSRSAAT